MSLPDELARVLELTGEPARGALMQAATFGDLSELVATGKLGPTASIGVPALRAERDDGALRDFCGIPVKFDRTLRRGEIRWLNGHGWCVSISNIAVDE